MYGNAGEVGVGGLCTRVISNVERSGRRSGLHGEQAQVAIARIRGRRLIVRSSHDGWMSAQSCFGNGPSSMARMREQPPLSGGILARCLNQTSAV